MSDINPRQPAASLQVSYRPYSEQGIGTAGRQKGHSPGDHAGSGGRDDSSHTGSRTHICKPNLQPEDLVLHGEEDYPTPPVTPAAWGFSPTSAGFQALQAQPTSLPRPCAATACTSEGAVEGLAGGHQETLPEVYSKLGNAASGDDGTPGKGGDSSQIGGEKRAWGDHGHEGSGASTVSVSQRGREHTRDDNNDARSRQHRPAATPAGVPSSSVVGRLRADEVWAEIEDFFHENGGCRDRSSRSKSSEATRGEARPCVKFLADKGKERCDHPKHLEGPRSDNVLSREGRGITENRSAQRFLPSEESRTFLDSDEDGENNSETPRRRMVSDVTNQSGRRTLGVPACITKRRSVDVGAEPNVEQEVHGLEQKRAVRRQVFDSFLWSDDEIDVLPGMKVCPEKCTGDGKSDYSGDSNGGGAGGIGHDEDCFPALQHTRVLGEQKTEIDEKLNDTFSGDKVGSGGGIRGRRGSDSNDAHVSVERGKHSMSEQKVSTREQKTTSPDTPDSVYNGGRQPPGETVEANYARTESRRGGGYNDAGGGISPTSVAASNPPEPHSVITDGARSGALSRENATTAVKMAGAGNDPVSIVTQSIPPDRSDGETIRSRQSSWRPTGLLGQVERVTTTGTGTPPADHDGNHETRAPWTPQTAKAGVKTIPPRGRSGQRPAATRPCWKAREDDSKNGSERVSGTLLREAYAAGGGNSQWEAWLNSDVEEQSDNDEHPPLAFREESHEGQENPSPPTKGPSTSPRQKRRISPDARPWLIKHSPQWIDFKRRRSSLLSHHFSNGPRISRTHSTHDSKLGRLDSCVHLPPSTASIGSRSLSEQSKTLWGTAGVVRNRFRAETLPSCTEVDHKAVAGETSADVNEGQSHSRTPSIGSMQKSRYPQNERSGEVRTTAGLGRHLRPSGTWTFDPSTHDSSFSGFSSEIDGSKSSIEVHNFLEESVGSVCEDRGGRDGAESTRGDGLYHRRGSADGRNNHGGGNDLDAQDIRFLSDGQKLRDVLLAVEDLHLNELPLTRQVELMRGLSVVHFSSGDVIFRQGDLSDALYFVLGPTTDPEDGDDDECVLLTTETHDRGDDAEGGGGDESKREVPFIPSRRVFGEEGLVYSKEHRRSYTVRAAVDVSLAVLRWPSFPHWREFRLYLLMKKVSLLAKLPCRAQTAVLHALKYADYDPGDLIIREGETGDKFYMITRGTVTVTVMAADSQDSVYSSSASSSAVDDDDDNNDGLPDEINFTAAFSSPAAIAGGEVRLSSSDNQGEPRCVDAFEAMSLPRPGTAAQQQHTAVERASAGATNLARGEPQRKEVKSSKIGKVVKETSMNTENGEEENETKDPHSRTGFQEEGGRGTWFGIDGLPTEKVLTRLYEGNCFGEMSLIYDEPRNASVRAMTEVTCVYLHKDEFRNCLSDKTFNSLMQQAALQTACYREQKAVISGHQLYQHQQHQHQHFARKGTESQTNFAAVRAAAAVRTGRRASFRATEQLKFAGYVKGETNERVINDYRVCEKVGEGSFGAVYKVVHIHSGEAYAMKVITKPKRGGQKRELLERSLRREVSVMQMLKHPNVVTLWEVIDHPRSRKVYMIQEFMEGGSLYKEKYAVEPLPEPLAISKFVQVARGLQYIHSFGICHGDIKPSNILEDATGRVKIADFGACVILNHEDEGGDGDISSSGNSTESLNDVGRDRDRRKQRRRKRGQRVGGTPSFHPPELFGEGGFSRISFASDIWALGVTLYQMIVGKMPFFGRSYRALMSSIKMEELSFPSECQIEPYLVNLLHRMLDKNPRTRITLEEAMYHEWVTKEGVCPGGVVEVPGQDRRRSEALRGIPYVALSQRADTQQRAARLRGVDKTANEGTSAGAGPSGAKRKSVQAWNRKGDPCTQDDTEIATTHDRQLSLAEETESRGGTGEKNSAPLLPTLPLTPSMKRSDFNRSSSSKPDAHVGEEDSERQKKQDQQQQPQRSRLQSKQERNTQQGGRGGRAEHGHHCRFGQEAAVAAAKRKTKINEHEVEEEEEEETWSDGDDKVPSPTIMEDIMDNCHLFIPPGMALHARTVTLPEDSGGNGGSGDGSGSGPMVSKLSVAPTSSPLAAFASASTSGLQQQHHHQQDRKSGSGTTFSKDEGREEYRQRQASPRSPLPPPLVLGVSSASSKTPTPPLPCGRTTTSGDRVIAIEVELENDDENIIITAGGANCTAAVTAREANPLLGIPPLPGVQTKEGGDSIAPTTEQQQESSQWHRGQHPKMALSSSTFSSPSLLCWKQSTRQNEEEKPAGGRRGDGEGKYRSVNSCPAIGATNASPLLARHELTDRSALERSQRLVRKPDFLMLRANPILGSNKRVVFSSLKAVSSLRASAEGEVGSRRSSVGVKATKSTLSPRFDAQRSDFKGLEGAAGSPDLPTTKQNSAKPQNGSNNKLIPSTNDGGVGDSAGGGGLLGGGGSSSGSRRGSSASRRGSGGWVGCGSSCGESRRESNNGSLFTTIGSDTDRSETSTYTDGKLVASAVARMEDNDEGAYAFTGVDRSFDVFGGVRDCQRGPVACDIDGDGDVTDYIGESTVERRSTSSRLTLFQGVDEGMGCIEEEPEQLETTFTTSAGAYNAKTRASSSGRRVTSDSSTSRCGNGHDRTEYTSTGTSYFESSGAESGNFGVERSCFGATLSPREVQLGRTSFQAIYAQDDGGVSGTDDGVEGREGAGGTGGNRPTRFVSAGERDEDDDDEKSSGDDSSSDGIGESASVADITDCLDSIGEGMIREDAELRVLDSEEIFRLTAGRKGRYRRTSSNKSAMPGCSSSRGAMAQQGRADSLLPKPSVFGHVQARAWASQVNIDVGVRFGVCLDQGKRCSMEDTASCLTDAFSVGSRGKATSEINSSRGSRNPRAELSPEERPVHLAAMTPRVGTDPPTGTATTETAAAAAKAAAHATASMTTATADEPEAAAYFGLFDGHGGADVAVRLQDRLHLRVLNNSHFPSDIPQAIRNGCLETDLECLQTSEHERQEVEKSAPAATSLNRQRTEQVLSGAVAVIAIIHRPPAPPTGAMPDQCPPQACSNGGAAHEPSHPQQYRSHSRHSSGSSFASGRCLKKRQYRQPVFLHVANVGDCRAVLCRGGNAVAITTDHTPSVPSEAARVEAAGGFVSRGRVNGILGVSRSFGDIHCKVYPPREGNGIWDEQQVISQPEVHSIELTEADNFLILACDGVWDVLSNQEAVSYVHRRLLTHRDVQRAAVELIDKALVTSGDNCSCLVICLNQFAASKKKVYPKSSVRRRRTRSLEGSTDTIVSQESVGSIHNVGSATSSRAGSTYSFDPGAGAGDGQEQEGIRRASEQGKQL